MPPRPPRHVVKLRFNPGRCPQLCFADPVTGRPVRRSTKTFDLAEAEEQRFRLQAELTLGIKPPDATLTRGSSMSIEEFCDEYKRLHWQGTGLRATSCDCAISRVQLVAKAAHVKTLGQLAQRDNLETAQSILLLTHAKHTVKSYLVATISALRWAKQRPWIDTVPEIELVKTSKLKGMKGRPITGEEFDRLLAVCETQVGPEYCAEYQLPLRLAISQGFREEELWAIHWNDEQFIVPVFPRRGHPTFQIPPEHQKNDTEEALPMTPWAAELLGTIPEADRQDFICRPRSRRNGTRLTSDSYAKLVSRWGREARILVDAKKKKFASLHDLRRSMADRLVDSGLSLDIVQEILRHVDVETTKKYYVGRKVQRTASTMLEAIEAKVCKHTENTHLP